MPTIRLNDLTVATLKTDAVQVDYYCDRTSRFGLRVTQHGTKTFFVFAGTPRKRHHLGKYPDTKLKDARAAAKRLLVAPTAEPGASAPVTPTIKATTGATSPITCTPSAKCLI